MNAELELLAKSIELDTSKPILNQIQKIKEFLFELTDGDFNGDNKEYLNYGLEIPLLDEYILKFKEICAKSKLFNIDETIQFILSTIYDSYEHDNYYYKVDVKYNDFVIGEKFLLVVSVGLIIDA